MYPDQTSNSSVTIKLMYSLKEYSLIYSLQFNL